MNHDKELTSVQKKFLTQVSAWIDEDAIGKKLLLIWDENRKCVRLGNSEISINLGSSDMFQLARLGYLVIYPSSTPKSIIFKESILQREPDKKNPDIPPESSPTSLVPKDVFPPEEPDKKPATDPKAIVTKMDIIQVYIWLGASLVFAVVAIVLLVNTVNALLAGKIPATVASGIITLVTSIAAAIFFRNYDNSNDRLRHFRMAFLNKGDEKP